MDIKRIIYKSSPFLFLIFISFLTLRPIFNLALTGDDLLGLWRYQYHVRGQSGQNWNEFNYFFTDYGPMDSFTAAINYFFQLEPFYYYFFNYSLRLTAALTFIPLIYYLTKNKIAAFLGALFFSVTLTGLEATEWSFNMPSYLGITFLNLFTLFLLKSLVKNTKSLSVLVFSLYFLSIVVQPIRMAFLPLYAISVLLIAVFFKGGRKLIYPNILKLFVFLIIFLFIIIFTPIGITFGLSPNTSDRISGKLFSESSGAISTFKTELEEKNYKIFFYPVGQLGAAFVPIIYIPRTIEAFTGARMAFFVFALYFVFAVYLLFLAKDQSKRKVIFTVLLPNLIWNFGVLYFFVWSEPPPLHTVNIIALVSGGFIFSILTYLLTSEKNKNLITGLLISIALVTTSFIAFWVRNPESIQLTNSRYLIVPAAGISLLAGCLFSRKKPLVTIPLSVLLVFNIYVTNRRLSYLSTVRNSTLSEKIRKSVPYNPSLRESKGPILYYLETDNPEVLYHTLYFGFPFFLMFEQGFTDPWKIVYTKDWNEIVSAYLDGQALKKYRNDFGQPVKIENIYSLRLTNGNLVDTTSETREKLIKLTEVSPE